MENKIVKISVLLSVISLVVSLGALVFGKVIFGGVYTSDTTQPIIRVVSLSGTSTFLNALTIGTSTLESAASTTFPNVRLGIDTLVTGFKGIAIRGVIGATGNLFEGQYATSTVIFYVDPDGNVRASGTLIMTGTGSSTIAGPLRPNANNTLDLGGFGSAWRDIYASGTLRLGGRAATTSLNRASAAGTSRGQGTCDVVTNTNDGETIYVSWINGTYTTSTASCL